MTSVGRKRWLFIAALVVVVGVVVYSAARLGATSEPVAEVETALAKRGELVINIETTGKFQSKSAEKIYPVDKVYDQQITWIIEDGTEVKKGDRLATLESQWLKEQLRSYDVSLEERKAQATNAREAVKIKKAETEAGIASSKLALDLAITRRQAYGDVAFDEDGFVDEAVYGREDAPAKGEAYQTFRDAELKVLSTTTQLKRAQADFNGMDELLDKGFVTQNDFDQADLRVLEAERSLESALLALRILRTYTHPEKVAQLDSAVANAKANLEKSQIEARSQLLQAETEAVAAEISLKREQDRYDELKKAEEGLEIKSPVDGMVFIGDPAQYWMRDHLTVGQQVWRGHRLFTIPSTSAMVVETRVLEMDLYKAGRGQEVIVTLEALPGVAFKGKVTRIAESTREQNWWMGEKWKYFGVEVELDESDARIKPGMSCDVEIICERLQDVVYMPIAAVFAEGDTKVCHVATDGGFRAVEVTTGKSTEKLVEITAGLEGGEKVALAQTEIEEEAAQKSQNNNAAKGGGPGLGAR